MTLARLLLVLALSCGLAPAQGIADIRPPEVRDGISSDEEAKGRALLAEMQQAYGLSTWQSIERADFTMTSVWHVDDSGWITNPQEFELKIHRMGSDDADLFFLNGPTKGQGWALEGGKHFDLRDGARIPKATPDPHTKVIIKNWWFQFPFRITEAEFVAYAGDEDVEGTNYHRVYATWGSPEPNETHDQYVLYIDPETKRMVWYYFTFRDANPAARISIEQSDFRTVDGVLIPYVSTVRRAPPGVDGVLVHENTYNAIRFQKRHLESE